MKKNTANRQPERRKPIKGEQSAKQNRNVVRARQNTHDRLAKSYNAVVGLHETAVEQISHVTQISKLVTHPDVKDSLTPEVEKELAKSIKVVIDGVRADQGELVTLTKELNDLCPNPKKVPRGDEAMDRNADLISLGSRYGSILEHHETVTMPAARTCLDLVNSVLPEDKKIDLATFDTEYKEAQASIETGVELAQHDN